MTGQKTAGRSVNLNLILLFDFYLAMMFLVSTTLRLRQYGEVLTLVRNVPSRWPKLFQLVKEHRAIFLTWSTFLPAILALFLLAAQMLASRTIWPDAARPPSGLSVARLLEHVPAVAVVMALGLAMIGVDFYATFAVGQLDRVELEKYFDQAEYWLRTWKTPVVRFFTLGYVNPRKMVSLEVRAALISASQLLNNTLWWVAVQTGLRVAYGLSLWVTFALTAH